VVPDEPSDTADALAPTTPTSSTGGDTPSEPPFRPSDRIGSRYQLEGLLGRGGMGAVYRARDEALGGQLVALKLVAGDVSANPRELKRLRDEVVLAQKVTHPNVCRTYDLEEIDGLFLIKMEIVEGESLAHRLRAGRLEIAEVVRIARQIVRGLAAAHRQGVIHRDLKPQNVMIEKATARIVLMDFGVARHEATRQSISDIVGTPDYMAPEQARGDAIDARADLYALGCVMYEMLTGVVPYPPRTSTMVRMTAPDPRIRRPDTPRWLGTIVRRLLARDAADRPRDAAEVAALLDRSKRRRIVLAAIAVGAALVVASTAWVVARSNKVHTWRPVLTEVLPQVDENFAELSISPDGKRIAFDSDRDQRNSTFRTFVGPIDSNEARAISPPGGPMLSSEWADDNSVYAADDLTGAGYRMPIDNGPRTQVTERGLPARCGSDAIIVQSYELDSTARFTLRGKGQPDRVIVEIKPPQKLVGTWHCSRDGSRLVYAVASNNNILVPKSDLWEAPLAGGAPRRLTNDGKRNLDPSFTPEGSIVFSSARRGAMNLWELPASGGEPIQLTFGGGDDLEPVVTPDGKRLVFALDNTSNVIRSYGEGPSRRISNARDFFTSPVATPDGRELVLVAPASEAIVAIDLGDGSSRKLVVAANGKVPRQATLTRDGKTIVYGVGEHPAEVFAMPRTGGEPRHLATLDGDLRILRAGADQAIHAELAAHERQEAWRIPLDGTAPAREGEVAFVLPAASGWSIVIGVGPPEQSRQATLVPPKATPDDPRIRTLTISSGPPDWSSDGNVLAYFDGTKVHRVDVRDGSDKVIAAPSDPKPWVAVSPDGKTIYVLALEGFVRRFLIENFDERKP